MAKLDPTGSKLLYSTFLGGQRPRRGRRHRGGLRRERLCRREFEFRRGLPWHAKPPDQFGIFVSKLAPQGTLVYSYFHPTGAAGAIALDAGGNVYVTGTNGSASLSTTMAGFPQSGVSQAIVFKISPDGSNKLYETAFGGSVQAAGAAIAVNSAGEAWVAGSTSSADFPLVKPLQSSLGARPLWKSSDGGTTWAPLDNLPFAIPQMLVVDPTTPTTLYAATADLGVFKSLDGGATWTAASSGIAGTNIAALAIDPVHSQTLYAATATAVYKTVNGAGNWTGSTTRRPQSRSLRWPSRNPWSVADARRRDDFRGDAMKAIPMLFCALAGTVHAAGAVFTSVLGGGGQTTVLFWRRHENAAVVLPACRLWSGGCPEPGDPGGRQPRRRRCRFSGQHLCRRQHAIHRVPDYPGRAPEPTARQHRRFHRQVLRGRHALVVHVLWRQRLDYATCVAVDPAGNVLVAGDHANPRPSRAPRLPEHSAGRRQRFPAQADPTGQISTPRTWEVRDISGPMRLRWMPRAAPIYGQYDFDRFSGAIAGIPGSHLRCQTRRRRRVRLFLVSIRAPFRGRAASPWMRAAAPTWWDSPTGRRRRIPNLRLAFVFKLSPDGSHLLYESFFGGSQTNYEAAIAVDSSGSAYIAGTTGSADFPLVHSLQPSLRARPLWKSTDGGNTWAPLDNLPFAYLQALAPDPTAPGTLFAGASDLGVFKTMDGGATWTGVEQRHRRLPRSMRWRSIP